MGSSFRILLALVVIPSIVLANRTSCFAYIDCYERAQNQLKDCVGGTAVALTVEAKDRSAAELVRGRGAVFNQCQDRLARELIDFDTLQILSFEDAHECFEKLPGTGKRATFNPAACPSYIHQPSRDNYGKETSECVIDYYNDRQKCEQLLDCCPDHSRCGERMNAVSVAYQHGKAKALQIVSNMLKCVASTDPSASSAVAALQNQRSTLRNAGLPFFRPDTATEERITRRLSLTSTASLEQRRQRFNRRYHQVRNLLSQKSHRGPFDHSTALSSIPSTSTTAPVPSDRRIAIIKNLLRNADDSEMATYLSLIADGDFDKLSALEKEKVIKAENEGQAEEASEKMTKIRDAIKAALATKEQKTLNFLETSGSTAERLALVALRQMADNEWTAEVPLSSVISKEKGEIDNDTLFRAKKFADALGNVLQAQKELILSEKDSFTANGLPATRTSSKAPSADIRQPHDFNALTHNLRDQKASTVVSADAEPTTTEGTTAGTTTETETTTIAVTEETTVETTTEGTQPTTTEGEFETLAPTTEKSVHLPQAVMELSSQPLRQSKMISIVHPKEGALEMIKTTAEETRQTSEILEELEAEVEGRRRGHQEEEEAKKNDEEAKKENEEGEIQGEDKRAVEEVVTGKEDEKVKEGSVDLKGIQALLKDGEVTTTEKTTEEVSTTTEQTTTTTEEVTTEGTTEKATEPVTETTTTTVPTTTKKPAKKQNGKGKVSLNEKSKNLMKKVVRDMKKKIEKLRNKVETSTEAAHTTIPAEDRPSLEVEPLTDSIEGSGMETTTAMIEPTTEKTKVAVLRDQGVNHCVAFADCDDLVRDYQEQCDRRFSPGLISHGIEEAEIVEALQNATVSHNDIVLRACLRPLDRTAYANLKQLLAIQRGVRRACLELGRNRPVLSEEQSAVCHSPLPSTEALDDFLSKTHARSEETHTFCLAKLAPLRETCHAVGSCCASVTACDNYIAGSPVKQLREEATAVLVQRQHACEERMLETLKYIQQKLSTRRRRV